MTALYELGWYTNIVGERIYGWHFTEHARTLLESQDADLQKPRAREKGKRMTEMTLKVRPGDVVKVRIPVIVWHTKYAVEATIEVLSVTDSVVELVVAAKEQVCEEIVARG